MRAEAAAYRALTGPAGRDPLPVRPRRREGRRRLPALLAAVALAPWLAVSATAQETRIAIDTPLTDVPGDPARGLATVRDASIATCLICHAMPIPQEPNHGTLGPPLDGVGGRYSEGELRQRVVDAKKIDPDTIMPAYYRSEGLYRVDKPYAGKTIYTAQQVEDVVAYLMTLKAH